MGKIPGIIKDPWRSAPTGPTAKQQDQQAKRAARTTRKDTSETDRGLDELHEDLQDVKFSTIELKNYGGITVSGTADTNSAAAQLLEFMVDHLPRIEPVLLRYGLVVLQLEPDAELNAIFYVRRDDGWVMAVPDVPTRDAGCLQLIQAMMSLYGNPTIRALLKKYRIQPYKV